MIIFIIFRHQMMSLNWKVGSPSFSSCWFLLVVYYPQEREPSLEDLPAKSPTIYWRINALKMVSRLKNNFIIFED